MITVLFVCTGNTCRSPIAAAIAAHYVRLHRLPAIIGSAGIHARDGDAITKDAQKSLLALGIKENHTSRRLSHAQLEESDVIYVMENWQAEAIQTLLKSYCLVNPPRVRMLDEDKDIPDPLGHGPEVYQELTHHILGLIPRKFAELAPENQPNTLPTDTV